MSSSVPSRRPTWDGVSPIRRPSFDATVDRSVKSWLQKRLLPFFFQQPGFIVGALQPLGRDQAGHVRINVSGETFVIHLKLVAGGADLAVAAQIALFLQRQGVATKAYVPSLSGDIEVASDGIFATVTKYLDGRHTEYSVADARAVGTLVGRTHKELSAFPEAEVVAKRTESAIARLTEIQHLLFRNSPDAIPAQYAELAATAARDYDPRFSFGGVPQCLHGDLSSGNVLFSLANYATSQAVLCDFEDAAFSFRPPLFDLGMAVLRFALYGKLGPDGSSPADRAEALLEEYGAASNSFPSKSLLRRSIRNTAFHSVMVLCHLAETGATPNPGEWSKPRHWLTLNEHQW